MHLRHEVVRAWLVVLVASTAAVSFYRIVEPARQLGPADYRAVFTDAPSERIARGLGLSAPPLGPAAKLALARTPFDAAVIVVDGLGVPQGLSDALLPTILWPRFIVPAKTMPQRSEIVPLARRVGWRAPLPYVLYVDDAQSRGGTGLTILARSDAVCLGQFEGE